MFALFSYVLSERGEKEKGEGKKKIEMERERLREYIKVCIMKLGEGQKLGHVEF